MILVKRPRLPDDVEFDCAQETAAAKDHFFKNEQIDGFKFTAYRHPTIVRALKALFKGKCAYCESKFAAVQPADIEHFRPKSAVQVGGKLLRPGYYWLAAAWENLLPSCIYCNRVNRHEDFIGDCIVFASETVSVGEYQRRERAQGKGNWFPLVDETKRSISTMSCSSEEPLLLDPCGDVDPGEHLAFDANGRIHPRVGPDGTASLRGIVTIEILALDRPDLNSARRERALEVRGDLELLMRALAAQPRDNEAIGAYLEKLANALKPSSAYVAMARDILDAEDPRLRPGLESLRAIYPLPASSPPAPKGGLVAALREQRDAAC